MLRIMHLIFNTQPPRLELTARVHSLSIHVPRMIPSTLLLSRLFLSVARTVRALSSHGDSSLFVGRLVSGSEGFNQPSVSY